MPSCYGEAGLLHQTALAEITVRPGGFQQTTGTALSDYLGIALERMGYGTVLLGASGQVLMANAVAIRFLQQEEALASTAPEAVAGAMKRLFRRGNAWLPIKAGSCVVIRRHERRDLVLHVVLVPNSVDVGAANLVIMVDLAGSPEPKPEVLQRMFGLTAAEARVAIRIARGDTPTDVAEESRVSIATVRSQLAAVFAKTQTNRQAELIGLLARVSVLS